MTAVQLMQSIVEDNTTRELSVYEWIDKAAELAEHLPQILATLELATQITAALESSLLRHRQRFDEDARTRWENVLAMEAALRALGVQP